MQDNVFVVKCSRISRRKAYNLSFSYNNELIAAIKNIGDETTKWNKVTSCWELTTSTLFKLIKSYKNSKKIYFDFGGTENRQEFINQIKKIEEDAKRKILEFENLKSNKSEWLNYKKYVEDNPNEFRSEIHKYLKTGISLFDYQVSAVMFMNKVRNCLLAMEMGTGKSITSIAYSEFNNFDKVLVITPNSLKLNYQDEVYKFTNSTAFVVGAKNNPTTIKDSKYIIFNYEYFNPSDFSRVVEKLKKLGLDKFDAVICDESHRIKSSKSNCYKALNKIFHSSNYFKTDNPSKIFMSGTPIQNKSAELYTVLNQISPLEFSGKIKFYTEYCGMVKDDYGHWVVDSSKANLGELNATISPYMFRKKKSDVLKDLPEKIFQKIMFEMNDKEYKEYYNIESGSLDEWMNNQNANQLTIMVKLRQYLSGLKIKNTIDFIENILECDEKIVVIDVFKNSLYELKKHFGDTAVIHTGDQSIDERNEAKKMFQDENSKVKIFLGSMDSSKEGLTLTAASKMIIMSMPFVPSVIDQVYSRIHRIGQKKCVNIFFYMFKDSIDEYIYNIIEKKSGEISKVIDNEEYKSAMNESIFDDLMLIIKEKHKNKV
jgi:SWI/SNF-related matrix-associated actin-dependent regulator of chromatin subfamily A-like protein 1